jgi:hypothetical protein
LPDWNELLEICTKGAKILSPLKFQSWDIGMSDEGPIVIEANSGSAFSLSQLATGKGFLTDEFLRFLDDCGFRRKRKPEVGTQESDRNGDAAPVAQPSLQVSDDQKPPPIVVLQSPPTSATDLVGHGR